MNTRKIRSALFALTITATATFGLVACNTGTEPGETNIERSDIKEEGSMIGEEADANTANTDTTDMEAAYERDDEGSAVHAGDGKESGTKREE